MRPFLTRQVFQRIIRNELYLLNRSWFQSTAGCVRRRKAQIEVRLPITTTRTLLGFSRQKPARKAPTSFEHPGFETLVILNNRLAEGVRPPSPEEVAEAFNSFFRARGKGLLPLVESQINQVRGAIDYLRKSAGDVTDIGLTNGDLSLALDHLAWPPKDRRYGAHVQLATLLFNELEARKSVEEEQGVPAPERSFTKGVASYIQTLAQTGYATMARDVLEKYWQSDLKSDNHGVWYSVVRGFAEEDNEDELSRTVATLKKYDIPFGAELHNAIVKTYARKDNVEATKKWYYHSMTNDTRPKFITDYAVFEMCIRRREFEWGERILRSVLKIRDPGRQLGMLLLKWQAAKGKGVDEIERMMNVMVRKMENRQQSKFHPDIDMINELIELAISKDDAYTAERYVTLGQKWNIQPDARTYLLQLDYRIKVGDFDGARAAYANLQNEDTTENQDLHHINKLIVALCDNNQPHKNIMPIVEDLSDRKVPFEPATVAALVRLHLNRGETSQADELLSLHALQYSAEERDAIRGALINHILNRNNASARAWEVYLILRTHFPDTAVQDRTVLMTEFFARKRSDMGMHVFGQMRKSPYHKQRPDLAAYIACFEGIARAGGDMQSLKLAHNMLKLDTSIEPNTRLLNGLMLAYTACDEPRQSLEFWNQIVHSREGPTYSSIQIALQACEAAPFGEQIARDIWTRLTRFGIKATKEAYAAYVGAIAGRAQFEECLELVKNVEVAIGEKADILLIGTLYNATQGAHNKHQIGEWAASRYPEIWAELLKLGKTPIRSRTMLEDEEDAEGDAEEEDKEEDAEPIEEEAMFGLGSNFNIDRFVRA